MSITWYDLDVLVLILLCAVDAGAATEDET